MVISRPLSIPWCHWLSMSPNQKLGFWLCDSFDLIPKRQKRNDNELHPSERKKQQIPIKNERIGGWESLGCMFDTVLCQSIKTTFWSPKGKERGWFCFCLGLGDSCQVASEHSSSHTSPTWPRLAWESIFKCRDLSLNGSAGSNKGKENKSRGCQEAAQTRAASLAAEKRQLLVPAGWKERIFTSLRCDDHEVFLCCYWLFVFQSTEVIHGLMTYVRKRGKSLWMFQLSFSVWQ